MPTIPLKEIFEAIKKAVDECGSESELARRCKLDAKVINRYMNKKVKRITEEKWFKLEPHIKAFLPPGLSFTQVNHGSTVTQSLGGHVGHSSDMISKKELISRILADQRLNSDAKLAVIELVNS